MTTLSYEGRAMLYTVGSGYRSKEQPRFAKESKGKLAMFHEQGAFSPVRSVSPIAGDNPSPTKQARR